MNRNHAIWLAFLPEGFQADSENWEVDQIEPRTQHSEPAGINIYTGI